MSGKQLPIYRLPVPKATRVGEIRIVKDRNGKLYIDGAPITESSVTGMFTQLTNAAGATFFVKTEELKRI